MFELTHNRIRAVADLKGVYLIAKDRDQALWLGDIHQGLFRLQNGTLSPVAKERFRGKPLSFLLDRSRE